jgi:ABC-type uncharacterized transport system ATPase subunit
MCQKVAITQALLSRPGLLVLDEAWTGLDKAARGALDAAALERAADGGTVMFVDHEQARLAGTISERWLLDGSGRVTVTAGDTAGPVTAGTVVIELGGLDADSAGRVRGLPGVVSARDATVGVMTLRVAAGRSDDVLRQVLAWDGVHVVSVRAEPAAPGSAGAGGPGAGAGAGAGKDVGR